MSATQAYQIRVAALTSYGTGAFSAAVTSTPLQTITAIQTVTATTTNRQVTLNWTAVTGSVNGYRVEQSTDGTTWTLLTTAGASTFTYTSTGLTNGTWYYYRVTPVGPAGSSAPAVIAAKPMEFRVLAINAVGAGAASSTVSVGVQAIPATPTNLTFTPGNGSLDFTWSAPAQTVSSYKIEYSLNGFDWIVAETSTSTTATSYTLTGLANGSTYFVRVSAINSAGTGAGVIGSATPGVLAAAPTTLSAVSASSTITLT